MVVTGMINREEESGMVSQYVKWFEERTCLSKTCAVPSLTLSPYPNLQPQIGKLEFLHNNTN